MSVFQSSEELYQILGDWFKSTEGSEPAKIVNQVGIIQYIYHNPEGRVTMVPEMNGEPLHVIMGDTDVKPLLTFEMNADVAHRFWLGKVDLTQALARQQMKATGPLSKALKVQPALPPFFESYKEFLQQIGRSELLEV